jgi:hypothetical protein
MSFCHNPAPKPAPKPFIVREISADMLRKHPQLSKGARMLWLAMKSMADHRTGELRHRQHWYTGKEIDDRAEISDETRKKYMRELISLGLVQMERVRVKRVLTDRLSGHRRQRSVLGQTHYTVIKSPHEQSASSTAKKSYPRKPCALQQPNASAVQEFGPQILSETHHGAASGVHSQDQSISLIHDQNHHPAPSDQKADDDCSFDVGERIGGLKDRASQVLAGQGYDPEFVQLALERIDRRSADVGTMPGSHHYYVRAFVVLLVNENECAELTDELIRRRRLREKYMGTAKLESLELTADQEARRQRFNQGLSTRKESGG